MWPQLGCHDTSLEANRSNCRKLKMHEVLGTCSHQTSPSRSLGTRCRRTAVRSERGNLPASGPNRRANSRACRQHADKLCL